MFLGNIITRLTINVGNYLLHASQINVGICFAISICSGMLLKESLNLHFIVIQSGSLSVLINSSDMIEFYMSKLLIVGQEIVLCPLMLYYLSLF